MANWFDKLTGGVNTIVGGVTDAVGLTDSKAPERARRAAESGINKADADLDNDLSWLIGDDGMFTNAQQRADGTSRSLGSNLDAYDTAMGGASSAMQGTYGAGGADNVSSYFNPKMDDVLARTMQNVQGGAGAALQSSATNRNAADAVGNAAAGMWDTAYNQAMGDAGNTQRAAMGGADLANQQLANDNAPSMNWAGLTADKATQRYAGQMGITEANVGAAGERNTIL